VALDVFSVFKINKIAMPVSRRKFLQQTAVFAGGSLLFSNQLLAYKKTPRLTGVQLYSVRDEMKKDPLDTLTKLAEMGYKHVEHANYVDRKFYGYTASEFRKVLDGLGLKMPSGHTVLRADHWDASKKDFTDAWKYTVEDAATMGQSLVISPSMASSMYKTHEVFMQTMELYNKSGELCQKSGMRFGYHNHDFEFTQKLNDVPIYDLMMNNTDPKLVVQQLDIGNMYNGGAKALDIMKKYPGRYVSMHVKDEIKATTANSHDEYESTILGAGIIPVKEVLDLAVKNGGTQHFIVEQETYQGKTPLESVKEDLAAMKKWGF
jgi:sugar phosphate isomerase/epimerase